MDGAILRSGEKIMALMLDEQVEDTWRILYDHRLRPLEDGPGTYADQCIAGCACLSTPGYYMHLAALVLGVTGGKRS